MNEKLNLLLKPVEDELKQSSLRELCRTNDLFAVGVLRGLCRTKFCSFSPTEENKFTQLGFTFPLETNDDFLECILDCVELLSGEEVFLSMPSDPEEAINYSLLITSKKLIDKLVLMDFTPNPWRMAGILFVDLNKNLTNSDTITVITSNTFSKHTLTISKQLDYLFL
jgi:hypothetical protein